MQCPHGYVNPAFCVQCRNHIHLQRYEQAQLDEWATLHRIATGLPVVRGDASFNSVVPQPQQLPDIDMRDIYDPFAHK